MAGVGSISSGLTGVLPVANGGTNTSTAFTAGSVVFAGASGTYTQDNINLFYDNTNDRLGIGTTVVDQPLHVVKSTATTNNITEVIHVQAKTTGTLASGFGPSIGFWGALTGGNNIELAQIGAVNTNIGGANGDIVFYTRPNAPIIERMRITSAGNVGIGITSIGAGLHLKAGTAGVAPFKFTSGTNLTTASAGAMEYNGTNLFFSPSTTRHTVNHGLTGSATLDFPFTLTMLSADLTITVTGAADGDVVSLGVPNAAVNANTSYSAWVSAANTVTVRFNNYSAGTVDPASGSFKVFVTK
jgi:hypothetical protein